MTQFYDGVSSIFVEAYDAFYQHGSPQVAGDTAFYADIGERSEGPILELACGTGRITWPLADRGLEITGVDLSAGMLAEATRKAESYSAGTRQRVQWFRQDMRSLALERRFAFAFVPFRSFQHLLSCEDQVQALSAIRRHLDPGGRLALHLFDPRLDLLLDAGKALPGHFGQHPATGRRYRGDVLRTAFDHVAQIRRDLWRYREIDGNEKVLHEDTREMPLRWTYRWELRHLLALCGFEVEAEYSDFARAAPAYGGELILVCRSRT